MNTIKVFFVAVMASTVFLSSCSKEEDLTSTSSSVNEFNDNAKKGKQKLQLSFSGLKPLDNKYRYEGWIMVNGTPVSTGKFIINPAGHMAPPVFNVDPNDLANATTFVLTIEPHPDNSPAPSATKILAGDFSGGMANLNVSHPAALGDDFTSATGKYLLATPTTASMSDENSGVWYIDNSSGSGMAGLMLPALPAGWRYEGWTVINGMALTTGKFMDPGMADMAAPFSGSLPGPPFPGEDYVMNAPSGLSFPIDLSGKKTVLTIEPYPDNSPNPFFLAPLAGDIPANVMVHTTYMMMNTAAGFPTGTAKK